VSARRRTPLGTQPPVSGTIDKTDKVEQVELSGPIVQVDPAIAAHEKALAADQENAVVVQIDDDWLTRLELPID